jgi:ribosomal protein S18 acetylase RimI-like enzyme
MIGIRRARPTDAPAIAAVHVAAWQSTYPGILPEAYLARLSAIRQAAHYDQTIRADGGVFVAAAWGADLPPGSPARVVGFTTAGPARASGIAEGEIETLYVLDDWRDRGLGRRLMRAAAGYLQAHGCRSVFLWVLRDNPSRWFYTHLGGRPVAESVVRVAGRPVAQTAFLWDPIDRLLQTSPQVG